MEHKFCENSVVMCVPKGTPTPFEDNAEGVCINCGCEVIYRPYIPAEVKKMCIPCVMLMSASDPIPAKNITVLDEGREEFEELHGEGSADEVMAMASNLLSRGIGGKFFRCACCGGVFEKGWSEEEAEAEMQSHFPGAKKEDCETVCDQCHHKLMAEMMRQANEQSKQ